MKRALLFHLLLFSINLPLFSQPLFTETFNYNEGALMTIVGLNATSPYFAVATASNNVSNGVWTPGSTSAFDDPLMVEAGALIYPGYSLSGVGKKLFCPNLTANTSNNRGFTTFASQQTIYYSLLLNLKDVVGLSAYPSTDGEYLTGVWSTGNGTNANYRGLLTFRRGIDTTKYQIGVRSNQPTTVPTSWYDVDLNPLTTYVVVVKYERNNPTCKASLWINPVLTSVEPTPNAVNDFGAVEPVAGNIDIGRFGIYQRASKPHIWLGGINIGSSWQTAVPYIVNAPSILKATSVAGDQIDVTFTPNANNDNVVIVWNNTGIFTTPTGTPPTTLNDPFAGGFFLSNGLTSPLNHTGLTENTQYYYRAFSYDGANYSSAVDAQVSTSVVILETFNYNEGALMTIAGLNATSPYYATATASNNVSNGVWTPGSTSAFDDPLMVEADALTYPGYLLSGMGNKVFCPNLTANTSNNRGFTTFTSRQTVYYSMMVNLKDTVGLSSNTSSNGEYFTGVWATGNGTNANYRGLLVFRAGIDSTKYQLGVRSNQPTTVPTSWANVQLDVRTTYLVVVKYERNNPTCKASLWINPVLNGIEPTPDVVNDFGAVDPVVTNTDIGRFGIYQRGSKPHIWLGGIRVANSWLPQLSPVFSANSTSFDMDTIHVGAWKKQNVVVTNSGLAPLNIVSITSSQADSLVFSVAPATASIAPGAQQTFVVTAKLDASVDRIGTLTFNHDGTPATNNITFTVHPLPVSLFDETFDYANGGLHSGNGTNLFSNVSNDRWFNTFSSTTITDSINVVDNALTYPGYDLSGLGKKILCPNNAAFDRAIRPFSNMTSEFNSTIYYAMMMKMKDVSTLSSYPSSYGEMITGVGPVTIPIGQTNRFAKAALRGIIRVRAGSVAGTWQVGINTSSAKTGPMGWYDVDLDSASTYLLVVRYTIGDSISLWVNPTLTGSEPAPTIKVGIDPSVSSVSDFGHFTVQQNGSKPICYLGGIRIATSIWAPTPTTFPLTVSINSGWNMVSVPGLHPTNQNVTTWWSGKDPAAGVFRFSGGYLPVTTTTPGQGYWMKHVGANTYETGGEWPAGGIQIVTHDPITAATGWNLIGGYETSVATSGITTTPAGLQTGSVFQYASGYTVATNLVPGYGYWIKLTGAGSINVPTSLAKGLAKTELNTSEWGKIIITDKSGKSYTLYTVKGKVNLNDYELPPAPPEGMFDVRFGSGRYAEELSAVNQTIELNSLEYPVSVRVENADIRLQDGTGNGLNERLKSGEEVTISNSAINKLMVSGEIVPNVYALEQNYPNPFNPSTKIEFSIPEDVSNVTLTIFNALGQRVAELVNSKLEAGKYSYVWNASDVATGLYIYELRTDKFVSVKKMMLLK